MRKYITRDFGRWVMLIRDMLRADFLSSPFETTKRPHFQASHMLIGRLGCTLTLGLTLADGGVTPGVA